ncbi:nucleoside-diphosphate sugar epimerase/dehydratase [uncultured Tateyamaria sp.]|uniref:polysaccharide biosynthesis protein n=1 Tax=uncultured Tateyamaria sp. TaxID=455651 RepID=UPI00261DA559|nr:nucleoside-diphosphate sugar epimerase/dehydratase [uncultured Tateyamaria sp.]
MLSGLTSLPRLHKRSILAGFDAALVPVVMLFAMGLTSATGYDVRRLIVVLPYLLIAAGAVSFWLNVSCGTLGDDFADTVARTAIFAALLMVASMALSAVSRDALALNTQITFGIALFVASILSRVILLQIVLWLYRRNETRCRVLIYGAGATGMQLASALRNHKVIEAVAFVDDNQALHGLRVLRMPVHSPVHIADLAADKQIDRVLLAIPSQSHPKQMQIARRLQDMGLEVQTLPSFSQLIGEEALVEKLKPLNPRRFLGRDEVTGVDRGTFEGAQAYAGRTVLITGAGGSIGSELCRQVLECQPAKLVLFDHSELTLYQIHRELDPVVRDSKIELVPILGCVTKPVDIARALERHNVQVVLHAAAYKHVPLVEENPSSGMSNNALGTHTLASLAAKAGVERFILISSDKAVRPTNVMGASKRLAELIVQDHAHRITTPRGQIFSTVRFGNVLGSSGSVVPLYQEQLRRGGPLTLTHPDVARYFMTVQEAVHLVLRAGSMAQGGEVFVLDMGKPVRIEHLARQVIESAGLTVRDAQNPEGDIAIEVTGLRPGEKLTEELTLNTALVPTPHKKIFFTFEQHLSEIEVASAMRSLRVALANGDDSAIRTIAARWVEGYGTQDPAPCATAIPAS